MSIWSLPSGKEWRWAATAQERTSRNNTMKEVALTSWHLGAAPKWCHSIQLTSRLSQASGFVVSDTPNATICCLGQAYKAHVPSSIEYAAAIVVTHSTASSRMISAPSTIWGLYLCDSNVQIPNFLNFTTSTLTLILRWGEMPTSIQLSTSSYLNNLPVWILIA